jgi:hypothetical protein
MKQNQKKKVVHVYSTPVAFASHPHGRFGTPLMEWNACHLAFALTCGTAIEQSTIGTLRRPRASAELLKERDEP